MDQTLCGEAGDEACQRLRDALLAWFDGTDVQVGRVDATHVQVRWTDGPDVDSMAVAVAAHLAVMGLAVEVTYRRALTGATFATAVIALHEDARLADLDEGDLELTVLAIGQADLRELDVGIAAAIGSSPLRLATASAAGPLVAADGRVAEVALDAGGRQLREAAEGVLTAFEELRDHDWRVA